MSLHTHCLSVLAAAALLAAPALAQTDSKQPTKPTTTPSTAPTGKAPDPSSKPGAAAPKTTQPANPTSTAEGFQRLAALAGEWNVSIALKMSPEQDPIVSRGTIKNEVIMDGHYLRSDFSGELEGRRVVGMDILTFNSASKKYQESWIDSRSSGLTVSNGTFDSATAGINFTGTFDDPATGKATGTRSVLKFIDSNKYAVETYATGRDGAEYIRMAWTAVRAKGAKSATEGVKDESKKTTDDATKQPNKK
jgi:hypothetical protein